jgi:hypothetical protein
MGTASLHLISWVVTAFVLVVLFRRLRRGPPMPVTFKSLDEETAVYGVTRWATKQLDIKRGDLRLLYAQTLYLCSVNWSWMGSIPKAELAVLQPFIDLMIEGKGPPQNLPAEYDDPRPEILLRFKGRMKTEGLWPES